MREDLRQLAEAVRQRVNSPEGQKSLEEALDRANETISHLKEARRIDPDTLKKPITI